MKEKEASYVSIRMKQESLERIQYILDVENAECRANGTKEKNRTDVMVEALNDLFYKLTSKTKDPDIIDRFNNSIDEQIDSKTIRLEQYMKQMKDQNNELLNMIHNLKNQNELLLKCLSVVLRSDLITNPDNFKKEQIFAYLDRESNWIELIKEWMDGKQ